MDIHGVPCTVAALSEEERIVEIRLESDQEKSILGNIYTGQVENIASNIQAAFVRFGDGFTGYLPLVPPEQVIFTAGRKGNAPLRAGDELLVQVSRDAMKGKLPALTTNLNFPGKYLVPIGAGLLVFFGIAFGLQFLRGKKYIVGLVISILVDLILVGGIFSIYKADKLLVQVGGATYKTDSMVVVVRADDSAKTLEDAKDYRYGIQTSVDVENTDKMLEDVEKNVGRTVKVEEYSTIQEEAEALLWGRIDAAIYNEALASVIEESIEDYSSQVKVLYQYGIKTEIVQEEEKNMEEPFNVYISGIDVSGAISTTSRSDVNIIMTVNPNTHKILLTSTPRDYYVTIPGVSGEQRDKLTHAGIYGVDKSMETLENLYGIALSYYARVNFTSLMTIVDALGGVDVNSEYEFTAGGYQFNKGVNHLDGKAALAFSRERYSFQDGDNQRGRNQEAVLTAILNKAMSPAILLNASSIISSVSDSVETNMTSDEMAKFINMQLSEGASWQIESTAAVGTGDTQACFSSGSQPLYVMWPDEATVATISQKMQQVLGGQ